MKNIDLIEKKRHGSPVFPIEFYHLDPEHPQYIMNAHWHRNFELIRVLKGCLTIYLGESAYQLCAGEILAVSGGILHRADPKDCVYECLVFDPAMLRRAGGDALEQYLSPIIELHQIIIKPILKGDTSVTARKLFDLMQEHPNYYEMEIYGLLFSLFSKIYQSGLFVPATNLPRSQKSKTIMELLSWLQKNFNEPLRLDTLAQQTRLSEKYLCRIFKEYTARTPIEYITELRIEHACIEMTTRQKSVTEAAYDSGFNDLSYFCKVFKRLKGMTPREYKNQHILHI